MLEHIDFHTVKALLVGAAGFICLRNFLHAAYRQRIETVPYFLGLLGFTILAIDMIFRR